MEKFRKARDQHVISINLKFWGIKLKKFRKTMDQSIILRTPSGKL